MTSIGEAKQELVQLRSRLATQEAALVDLFLHQLSRWVEDDSSAESLIADLDRILGDVWFSSRETRATVVLTIARLRDTVAAMGGMTMNERLYFFDLMDRWDRTPEAERDALYRKVMAKR